MRRPNQLSHSGFALWESNPDEFYLKYLSEKRAPRIPQERPAAAGSSFDAYVKAHLQHDLGLGLLPNLLGHYYESQVEPQNRDWALPIGAYIFDCYKISGFYDDLLNILKPANNPRFEFSVEAEINGVPFNGKPDLGFDTAQGIAVVHDWKCNGMCSKSAVSPHKSYMKCRDGFVGKQTKSHDTEHKEFLGINHMDLTINTTYLEHANPKWADQLSLYGWALGEKIGDEDVVLSIHQIVAKPIPNERPQLRVAQYRARVTAAYQQELARRFRRCWDAITSGHIFLDMSREDSDARCAILEDTAVGLQSDGSSLDSYFAEATREGYRG